MFNTNPTINVFPTQAQKMGLSDAELNKWREQEAAMTECWDWWTGKALKEQAGTKPGKDGKIPLRYPLQVNPIRLACQLHAYALIGQTKDTSEPLVKSIVEPGFEGKEAEAELATKVLGQMLYENNARSLFTDMFLSIQSLGAQVVKIGWDPNPVRSLGIRLEYIDPRNFFCRHDSTDYWNLTEAWVKLTVDKSTAARYGVSIKNETAVFIEHWTLSDYSIRIGDEYALDTDKQPINRPNPWGFIPFVYIPHERAGTFNGNSLVTGAIGLSRELNARYADLGDAIKKGVHRKIIGKNIRTGHPQERDFPSSGGSFLDLGRQISSADPEPVLDQLPAPDLPEGYLKFLDVLENAVRMTQLTNDAAYGEQEGSQRSASTMLVRLWAMLSHVGTERIHWTTGLNYLCEYALIMLAKHKRGGITQAHLGLPKRQDWASMIPIDHAQLVLELLQRWEQGTISLELLLEKMGDVPYITEEIERIKAKQAEDQQQQMAQTQAEMQLKNTYKQAASESP